MEIKSLLDKEFKMFNEIKVIIDKHNKNLYKELENIKKNQTELKSISEIKKKKSRNNHQKNKWHRQIG